MITLALDASTYRGTVAVLRGERVLVQHTVAMRNKDAELLMPSVEDAARQAGVALRELDRIVCGAGPGSFTSLRIAASIAKGIASAASIPLYAVTSLALIVAGNVKDGPRGSRRYLAVLDALRGESYVGEFEHVDGRVDSIGEPRIVPADSVAAECHRTDARAVGPDQPDAWQPHARGVALLEHWLTTPVDLASWEPHYGRLAEAQVKWEATHGRALR